MKKRLIIVLGLVLSMRVLAMTVEQEQRFLYYFYEAERLWQAEQYTDAYNLFTFCHTLHPSDAMTNRYIGHVYKAMKHPERAISYYRLAWQQAPTECWKDYTITLYNMGEAYQQEAIAAMEKTSKSIPQDAELWNHLRDAYLGVKAYKKALEAQDKIDKIEGYDAYSAMSRYRIYMIMHKPQQAIEAIDDYLKEDPKNLQFLYYKMQIYEMLVKKANKLIPLYQEILLLDPFNAQVLNNYAYLLATNKGDLKQAEKMSGRAVQAEPQNPTFLDTYAWILYLSGQSELAKLYIRQALNLLQDEDIPQEIQQHYNVIWKE